jgi:hypothetical protein
VKPSLERLVLTFRLPFAAYSLPTCGRQGQHKDHTRNKISTLARPPVSWLSTRG